MNVKSKKYRAKGGGLIHNASKSIDTLTRLAMNKLNLKTNYTRQQSAGMAPPMNQGAPPGGAPPGGAPQPTPAQENELKKTQKELKTSKKKNKKLTKKNKTLKIENNELRKKLTSVSEDIVKLQDVLPNINQQIKQMLQDMNEYKVYKTENEKNDTKFSIEKPYFEKNPKEPPAKSDYSNFLNKFGKKTKKTKKNDKSNNSPNNKSKESNNTSKGSNTLKESNV